MTNVFGKSWRSASGDMRNMPEQFTLLHFIHFSPWRLPLVVLSLLCAGLLPYIVPFHTIPVDLPRERVTLIRRAALLHDMGKLSIPSNVLNKPAALTPDEWKIIKNHPLEAERIIGDVSGLQPVVVEAFIDVQRRRPDPRRQRLVPSKTAG